MPVRIRFDNPGIRVHICPESLKDFVIEDIRTRYQSEPIEIREVSSIHLDPGGMAFMNPEMIEFEIEDVPFSCNAEHLSNVLMCLQNRHRIIDQADIDAPLARVYFWLDLVVVPVTFLWAIENRLKMDLEKGAEKAAEIASVLAGANGASAEMAKLANVNEEDYN